jgi:hypothetical protein
MTLLRHVSPGYPIATLVCALFLLVLESSNPGCATFLDFTSYSILIDSGVLLPQLFRVRVENFLFGCPLVLLMG